MGAFCARYPKIEIDLLLSDTLVDLVAQQVDVALRLGPCPAGDLIVSKLKIIERRLVASKEYLSSVPTVGQPRDIVTHVCLPTTNSPQPPLWLFRRDLENIELVSSQR